MKTCYKMKVEVVRFTATTEYVRVGETIPFRSTDARSQYFHP